MRSPGRRDRDLQPAVLHDPDPAGRSAGAVAIVAIRDCGGCTACRRCSLDLGIGNLIKRWGREFEPSLAPGPGRRSPPLHPRTVLTDTPVVALLPAFAAPAARPAVQHRRPGRAADCARPCVIVDDLAHPDRNAAGRRARARARCSGRYGLILDADSGYPRNPCRLSPRRPSAPRPEIRGRHRARPRSGCGWAASG